MPMTTNTRLCGLKAIPPYFTLPSPKARLSQRESEGIRSTEPSERFKSISRNAFAYGSFAKPRVNALSRHSYHPSCQNRSYWALVASGSGSTPAIPTANALWLTQRVAQTC